MKTMRRFSLLTVTAALVLGTLCPGATAQQDASQLVEPIFRVTHEEAAEQPPQVASRIGHPKPATTPFELTPRPGEHPLMPAMRLAKESLKTIDTKIHDYNAVLLKQERIDGELQEEQAAFIKVRHQPFSVYMFFLKPFKGRECLYNAGPNGEKGVLVAMDCGWKRRLRQSGTRSRGHPGDEGPEIPHHETRRPRTGQGTGHGRRE